MKLSFTLTTLVIALAAPITAALPQPAISDPALSDPALPDPALPKLAPRDPPEDANAWCTWRNPGWVFEYRVVIKEVDDVGMRCDRLWSGLANHRFLCTVTKPNCQRSEIHEKGLEWSFTAGMGCDVGCVQSAFWEATRNKFGSLDVSQCQG